MFPPLRSASHIVRLARPLALAPGYALRSMAAGFAVCNPARPAHAAPEPAAPPQSTAFPWLAAARLPPLLVPLVVLRMLVVFVVMADTTCACVLSLLVLLYLFYCTPYTYAVVLLL